MPQAGRMPESFEMFRYIDHLRSRWPVIAVACGAAIGCVFLAALLMPARYEATARILIQQPRGADVRYAMAMSAVYLDSLRSYELVASGDRLFLDAMNHFNLAQGRSVEQLKRSVLKVSVPRNTRILEISVTLGDPVKAQALALYVAEETVRVTHEASAAVERELLEAAQKQLDDAEAAGAKGGHDASQTAVDVAVEHLAEVRASAGGSIDELGVVDPGVVPSTPTSPNIPVMLTAAFLMALAGSVLYLTFEFNYRLERFAAPHATAPLARVKSLND
jgi:capsular polysaccharide biosynthesis protein